MYHFIYLFCNKINDYLCIELNYFNEPDLEFRLRLQLWIFLLKGGTIQWVQCIKKSILNNGKNVIK